MSINKKPIGKKKTNKLQTVKLGNIVKVVTETPIPNPNKVPARLWKSFGRMGQKVFNETYDVTYNRMAQSNMTHPKQQIMPKEQWKTLCWNFSCHAAWSTKNL